MSKLNRVLLVIVILLAIVTAVYWFMPEVIMNLNPFGKNLDDSPATSGISPVQDSAFEGSGSQPTVVPEEMELSPLEKDIQQRHMSYQTKIYSYEPYEPPVVRNPFQRVISSVLMGDEEEQIERGLTTEEDIRRFVQPEMPPGSKFTGLISSGDNRLAILEIDGDTYIVKEGDLILDQYLVKSIVKDKVLIEIKGYEISLQLGGGNANNE